jgi:crotonobetainyl-CoA:carnitine CoA-transferase CaiB-like acyl-CoA transferase
MHLAVGLLSAVEARHRTGKGQYVEASLLDSVLSLGLYEAAHVFAERSRPPRLGQGHRGSSPYQVFETNNGWITVGAAQQSFWELLCDIVGMAGLKSDERFLTNADRVRNNDALVEILQDVLKRHPSAHWLDAMNRAGIPCGPVLASDEILSDPHVLAREMVVETEHPTAGKMKTLGVVAKLSNTPGAIRHRAPRLGEHTEQLLSGLR